jgi:hypothetical protein
MRCAHVPMVTRAEIESAAAGLSPSEKQELMLFMASRLRAEGAVLPEPQPVRHLAKKALRLDGFVHNQLDRSRHG